MYIRGVEPPSIRAAVIVLPSWARHSDNGTVRYIFVFLFLLGASCVKRLVSPVRVATPIRPRHHGPTRDSYAFRSSTEASTKHNQEAFGLERSATTR